MTGRVLPVFGVRTDTGRVRSHNEDAVWAESPLFAVADGMGGHAAGEVASALVLATLAERVAATGVNRVGLVAAVEAANRAVLEEAAQRPETAGMGTTLTGLALGEVGGSPHWFVFNVGDSRVYHLAGGQLTQVTVDHSEVEELLSRGELTTEQAVHYPRRNVVTRSIGSDPAPSVDVWTLPVEPGEIFLACSDGLTLELSDEQIAEVLRSTEPQTAADTLVARALDAGARDNVSAVVVMAPALSAGDDIDATTAPRQRFDGSG